jgi:uncharacterized protein
MVRDSNFDHKTLLQNGAPVGIALVFRCSFKFALCIHEGMDFDTQHKHILEIAQAKIVAAFPDVLAIYVFGSFGTKYERQDSDVDLAILSVNPAEVVTLWNLAQEIAIAINRDVDLIDLKNASTVFRHVIISSGTRFYTKDASRSAFFENSCSSMYLRFKDDRALWMK